MNELIVTVLFLVVACTVGAVVHSLLCVAVNYVASKFVKEQDD